MTETVAMTNKNIPNDQVDSRTPIGKLFARLGAYRDGFLVVGAVIYGLGYLVWSYNAWRNHLGQLPALEFQYLIAGVIPAILIALGAAGAVYFTSINAEIAEFAKRHKTVRYGTLIFIAIVQLLIGIGRWLWETHRINLPGDPKQISRYTFPLLVILVYMTLVTAYHGRRSALGSLSRFIFAIYKYSLSILFCWYSLALYVDLYPRLPQELGGPQPRCAHVDLVKDETSLDVLNALVTTNAPAVPGVSPKVIPSNELRVYFANSEYLLVRNASEVASVNGATLANIPLYELRKDTVRAIRWCH